MDKSQISDSLSWLYIHTQTVCNLVIVGFLLWMEPVHWCFSGNDEWWNRVGYRTWKTNGTLRRTRVLLHLRKSWVWTCCQWNRKRKESPILEPHPSQWKMIRMTVLTSSSWSYPVKCGFCHLHFTGTVLINLSSFGWDCH